MADNVATFSSLLRVIVDNRGRTCPTAPTGKRLIATNCIRNDHLFPSYENVRFVDDNTLKTWFRGHPESGDLIFVTKGTPGRVCLVPEPVDFCIAQDMVAIRADESKVYPQYLFALLRSTAVQERIKQLHVGTLIPHFKKGDFDKLLLPLPDKKTQKFIGDIYLGLSAKIELNRRMNETLEAMTRALFKSWFVGFDPARVKVDDLAKDGVLEIGDGYRAKNSELGGPGLPFIRGGDLNNGFDTAGAEILNQTSVAKAGNKISREGDVAFTSKGTIGRFARVNAHTERFVYSPQVCYWRTLDFEKLNPTVLYCWMTSGELLTQILAISGQTDMAPYASLRDQRTMEVPIFTETQHELAFKVEPLLSRQALLATESKALIGLRDTLLPKLISGELRVKTAEKMVEAVA